jgi:signal transduction histidine kinase
VPIRLLHLEDDLRDRELIAEMLRSEHVDCTIVTVDSREAFERALTTPPDLILADYSLPGFDGTAALDIALTRCPDVPFVFVSGSIGEQRAVERLKNGATDYVLKDHLEKLPTAVRRAIAEAENRRQRAHAEAELRRLNTDLEARVEERTRALVESNEALQQARAEADRANRAKSEFLSRMSHDLRTPLNAIMGFAQLLELDPLSPTQSDSVAQILRGSDHLLRLINDILDIARIEAGRLSLLPETVGAADVLQQAVALIQPLAVQREITISIDVPPGLRVHADPQRLTQILLNLLSNAVKYNREQGSVHVSATRHGDACVRFQMADTGAGIPEEKMALLFKPFERLGAETTGVQGTGLGLALSKWLAEAMNGSLTIQSVVMQGTTLLLDLPVAVEASTDEPLRQCAPVAACGCAGTILYIEDNASNLVLMQRLLALRPHVVLLHAADGHTGLNLVRTRRPDLVVLDLHLSDMSGEDVLRCIRENSATRSVPVAVLSADATAGKPQRLLASGAVAYLTKPFDIADVLQLIDRMLGAPNENRASMGVNG